MVLDLRLTMKIVVVVRQPFFFYRGGSYQLSVFFSVKEFRLALSAQA